MTPIKKSIGRLKITWLGSDLNGIKYNSAIPLVEDTVVILVTLVLDVLREKH